MNWRSTPQVDRLPPQVSAPFQPQPPAQGLGGEGGARPAGMGGEWGQDKFSVILVGGSSLRGGWEESTGCFDGGR